MKAKNRTQGRRELLRTAPAAPAAHPVAERAAKRAYRITEFCEAYSIGRSQAYVEIAEGRLKLRKVGRRSIIAAEDADAWLAACAVGSRAA